MEEDDSKAKKSGDKDEIKTQEEAERLDPEESTVRKEEEHFLQEELEKLLAEKETSKEAEKLQRRQSQESKAREKVKGQKSSDGTEQPIGQEKAEVEKDDLKMLDEPWKIPKEPSQAELEKFWDNLTLLEEPMLEKKPEEKQEVPSEQDKVEKVLEEDKEDEEDEDEDEDERDHLSLKEKVAKTHLEGKSSGKSQTFVKNFFAELFKEEEKMGGETQKFRPPRTSIGMIWEQKKEHFQKIKGSMQRRKLSMLPFGYFSRLSKNLFGNRPVEKGEQSLKLPLERGPVTKLSQIFTENILRTQDTTNLIPRAGTSYNMSESTIEDNQEEDHLPSDPEDFDVPKEEVGEVLKKQTNPQSERKQETKQIRIYKQAQEASRQQCDSVYSQPGIPSSVWHLGQRVSHWHVDHTKGFPDSLFQDKEYKHRFMKHERDSKLAELMEEEVLAILKATLLDYQKKLGANHPLTEQMEDQVDKLHLQLQGRGAL